MTMQITDAMSAEDFERIANETTWEPTEIQIDAIGELVFEAWGELGEAHRKQVRYGLKAAFALAVATAPVAGDAEAERASTDAEFESAVGVLLKSADPSRIYRHHSKEDSDNIKAARARVLALNRSAKQAGRDEAIATLREIAAFVDDNADANDIGSWGLACDVVSFVESKIDAMLEAPDVSQ